MQLLPLSMLALRVTKSDPHEGHDHPTRKDPKRVKGLWTVKVEREQDFEPMMHYVWFYEGPQWKRKVMAGGALILLITLVMFPLWPMVLRQGVWYLSVGMMGLIGLFFAMSIFRLILFCATVFTVPPGLWLYPNLFEDVGFFDSFRPVWGWQEVCSVHVLKYAMTLTSKRPRRKAESQAKATLVRRQLLQPNTLHQRLVDSQPRRLAPMQPRQRPKQHRPNIGLLKLKRRKIPISWFGHCIEIL